MNKKQREIYDKVSGRALDKIIYWRESFPVRDSGGIPIKNDNGKVVKRYTGRYIVVLWEGPRRFFGIFSPTDFSKSRSCNGRPKRKSVAFNRALLQYLSSDCPDIFKQRSVGKKPKGGKFFVHQVESQPSYVQVLPRWLFVDLKMYTFSGEIKKIPMSAKIKKSEILEGEQA